jgi:hypothetical protein
MFDQPLSECVDRAIARLEVCPYAPAAGGALRSWAAHLSSTARARDYFDDGLSVMFLVPWWLEKRIRSVPDIRFQERLVESSVNAYYFVRLIDNVMDENAERERNLLPLLGLLHSAFIRPYFDLFPADAAFWDHFDRHWGATMEAAFRDKRLTSLSADDFVKVAAQKTAGVKIPLAAVCCRYERVDLLQPWSAFYDRLAQWQQMANDTFDWIRDLRHGNTTFFLSEGYRQKRTSESVSGWVVRGGFAWAVDWLHDAMWDVRREAAQLDCPELERFLEYRDAEVRDRELEVTSKLAQVAWVADAFEPVPERD